VHGAKIGHFFLLLHQMDCKTEPSSLKVFRIFCNKVVLVLMHRDFAVMKYISSDYLAANAAQRALEAKISTAYYSLKIPYRSRRRTLTRKPT
jgi:hypothetical protein